MPDRYDEGNRWRDRARSVASGALMAFNDEVEAALRAAAQLDPEAYRREVERIRAQQAAYEEAHPVESAALETTGAVGTAFVPVPGAQSALAAKLAGMGKLGNLAVHAAPDIAQGVAYGAGSAENIGDIPRAVGEEALLAAGMYGAGRLAAKPLGAAAEFAAKPFARALQAMRGGNGALRQLEEAFRAGATLEELTAAAQEMGAQIDPVALRINIRMRDEAAAKGVAPHPDVGRFVPTEASYDPEALAAARIAERQLAERELAVKHNLPDVLSVLPPEEQLRGALGLGVPAIGRARPLQAIEAPGVHISRVEGLTQTDPLFFGTGHRGTEVPMVKREGLPDRTYFYSGEAGTVRPEAEVMGRNSDRFAYTAQLPNLYDVNADPEQLVALSRAYNLRGYEPTLPHWATVDQGLEGGSALPDLERMIADRGYSGYISDFGPSWNPTERRAAAMFEPVDVTPTELRERYMNGGFVK